MEGGLAIKKLGFGTLFKIIFWAGVCVWLVISVLIALVALVIPSAVTVNGVQATSATEAISAAPMFLVAGTIMTAIFASVSAGLLRLVGRYLPLGLIKTSE